LSKKARRVVWQNIGFALLVNVFVITGEFVINLSLPLGVLRNEGRTIIAILNGLTSLLAWPIFQRRRMMRKM